jgi:threonine/homoserine/homoserine lactone efflux protein
MAGPSDGVRTQAPGGYAVTVVRRSWRHMGLSVAMCAAILGWYASRGASPAAFIGVTCIGVFLVIYDVIRIVRARDALAEPDRLDGFASEQRRSHRVRGRIYLVTAPVLVVVTWIGMLASSREPWDSWAVLIGGTTFLAAGWAWWFNVLRRLPARDRSSAASR